MFLASKDGNVNLVRTLLKYHINVEMQNSCINAQALAWQASHYDVVLELAKANFTYPQSMNLDLCSQELFEFIAIAEILHDHVDTNSMDDFIELLNANKNQRYFYNSSNESLMKIAILKDNLEFYKVLVQNGCAFGPHEDTNEIYERILDEKKKSELCEIHVSISKQFSEKHINILMANSFLNHDETDDNDRFDKIYKAYKILYENDYTKVILKAIASSKKFRIIYDFDSESVSRIDPNTPSSAQGVFELSGRIVIGAKQLLDSSTENDTYAVMTHEFCHYAVHLAYNNMAKPYKENDTAGAKEFEEVVEACQNVVNGDNIVSSVFTAYSKESFHAELIVRVPHLVIFYRNHTDDTLPRLEIIYGKLFDVYKTKVMPQMEKSLKEIENSVDIEKDKIIEKNKEIIRKKELIISEKDNEIKERIVENIQQKKIIYILIAISIITAILVGIIFYKPTYTFWDMSESKQDKVRNAFVIYKDVHVKMNDLFSYGSEAYKKLSSEQITNLLDNKLIEIDDPRIEKFIFFNWANLTGSLKEKVLNTNLTFQNQKIKFNDLHPNSLLSLKSNEILIILNGDLLKVGTLTQNIKLPFYIDRTFMPEKSLLIAMEFLKNNSRRTSFKDYYMHYPKENLAIRLQESHKQNKSDIKNYFRLYENEKIMNIAMNETSLHKSVDKIINTISKNQTMILSSEPGSGKSVVFEEITLKVKEKYPTKWVSSIDINKHKKIFANDEHLKDVGKILEDILGLDDKSEFEKSLFKESFNAGHCVIIWNDFDEIKSSYSKFMIKIISYIHMFTNNYQFISTRPTSSEKLTKILNVQADMLVPFNDTETDTFLNQFFKFKSLDKNKILMNIKKVKNVLNLSPRSHDIPLVLNLISERVYKQIDSSTANSTNYYQIYYDFMTFKNNDKMKKIHQHFALRSSFLGLELFSFPFLRNLQIIKGLKDLKRELSYDEISQKGILKVKNDNDFEFEHRTYAEFFVSQYLIENIYKVDPFSNKDYDEIKLRLTLFFNMLNQFEDYEIIFKFIESFIEADVKNSDFAFDNIIKSVLEREFKSKILSILNFYDYDLAFPSFSFFIKFFGRDRNFLLDLLKINDKETFCTTMENPYYSVDSYVKQEVFDKMRTILDKIEFDEFIKCKNNSAISILSNFNEDRSDFFNINNKQPQQLFWTFYDEYPMFRQNSFFFSSGFFYAFKSFELYETNIEDLKLEISKFITEQEMPQFISDLLSMTFRTNYISSDEIYTITELTIILLENKDAVKNMILSSDFLFWAARHCDEFESFWDFIKMNTNKDERKELLLSDLGLKNFTNYYTRFEIIDSVYTKMFHRIFFDRALDDIDSCVEIGKTIFKEHFSSAEVRKIILESKFALIELIRSGSFELISYNLAYFRELFDIKNISTDTDLTNDRKSLKIFFEEKIIGTDLNLFEYLTELDDLFENYDLRQEIKELEKLYNIVKND